MHTHEHYEELCALAATGQIPEGDLPELQTHLSACLRCRALVAEFTAIGSILSGNVRRFEQEQIPAGMTERFLARAHSSGIAIDSAIVSRPPLWRRQIPSYAAAALFLAAFSAVLMFWVRHERNQLGIAVAGRAQPTVAPAGKSIQDPTIQSNRIAVLQLDAAKAQEERLIERLNKNRDDLDRAAREKQQLLAQLNVLQEQKAQLEATERDRDGELASLREQLERVNAEKIANEVAVGANENELRALRNSLATKEAALQQQQHLIGVGNQVRDLIVARNLHIIDVYDRDGDGKRQQPFGRIFYTEGKSLIFYAYDLGDPRAINKHISFYAWGESLEGGQPVKSLGIFHNEDTSQGRWSLSFDDPQVLAKIDSVFVTVEQDKKPITQPNGKKILFAYLGNKANHP